ncbi:MAG: hypothetical protein R8P61_36615 [Bacteroidia bacterium]|nr:hypothetical protein [Bacteroidia bacterium]
MKRIHIPQISDQSWFPGFLSRNIHEFMSWFVGKVGAAAPFLPIIEQGLEHADQIIAIEEEQGAGFETLAPLLDADIPIKYQKIDELNTKESGLYVSVNAFHKLKEEKARNLLRRIASEGHPLAIVEGNNDSLWQVFGMTVIVPLTVLLATPFVKPFRFSRIIFTYLLPVLPLVTFLDGAMALLKLYAPTDLDELTSSLGCKDYSWKSGKLDNGRGGKIIYLLGYPERVVESV